MIMQKQIQNLQGSPAVWRHRKNGSSSLLTEFLPAWGGHSLLGPSVNWTHKSTDLNVDFIPEIPSQNHLEWLTIDQIPGYPGLVKFTPKIHHHTLLENRKLGAKPTTEVKFLLTLTFRLEDAKLSLFKLHAVLFQTVSLKKLMVM